MIYQTMVKGYGKRRRDMVYEKDSKGGMGMTHIGEEYKINRLRGITQMVETADRQEGRKQEAWIQKKIMKDLQRTDPYLNVVKEMQEILQKELNIEVQDTSERYSPWALQTGLAGQTQQNPSKKRKTLQPAELRVATIKREDLEIPTHLVQMYERQGHTLEEALVNAQERMKERPLTVEEGQMAVRIKK